MMDQEAVALGLVGVAPIILRRFAKGKELAVVIGVTNVPALLECRAAFCRFRRFRDVQRVPHFRVHVTIPREQTVTSISVHRCPTLPVDGGFERIRPHPLIILVPPLRPNLINLLVDFDDHVVRFRTVRFCGPAIT